MKPVLISQLYNLQSFVPPVTGTNGRLASTANYYDTSGNFSQRGRLGSAAKRKRTAEEQELDQMFDLSQLYPPLSMPERPGLDVKKIQEVLVVANTASQDVRSWMEEQDCDSKVKAVGGLALALLDVVGALTENGIVPVTTAAAAVASRGSKAAAANVIVTVPPEPGLSELKECLNKADKECILFDANLGTEETFNRQALAANLTRGLATLPVRKPPAITPST
jgi:hypothetical protein